MKIDLSDIGKFTIVVRFIKNTSSSIEVFDNCTNPYINGKQLYYKNILGNECWSEYDFRGNLINFKTGCGFEGSQVFDSNGNIIYYKNNQGCEWWKDSSGRQISELEYNATHSITIN